VNILNQVMNLMRLLILCYIHAFQADQAGLFFLQFEPKCFRRNSLLWYIQYLLER